MEYLAEIESYVIEDQFTMWLEQGIVFFDFEPETRLSMDLIQCIVNKRNGMGVGYLLPFVIDLSNLVTLDAGTLPELVKQLEETSNICTAILVNSEHSSIIARAYKNVCGAILPTEIFPSIIQAQKWMNNYKLFA